MTDLAGMPSAQAPGKLLPIEYGLMRQNSHTARLPDRTNSRRRRIERVSIYRRSIAVAEAFSATAPRQSLIHIIVIYDGSVSVGLHKFFSRVKKASAPNEKI